MRNFRGVVASLRAVWRRLGSLYPFQTVEAVHYDTEFGSGQLIISRAHQLRVFFSDTNYRAGAGDRHTFQHAADPEIKLVRAVLRMQACDPRVTEVRDPGQPRQKRKRVT